MVTVVERGSPDLGRNVFCLRRIQSGLLDGVGKCAWPSKTGSTVKARTRAHSPSSASSGTPWLLLGARLSKFSGSCRRGKDMEAGGNCMRKGMKTRNRSVNSRAGLS